MTNANANPYLATKSAYFTAGRLAAMRPVFTAAGWFGAGMMIVMLAGMVVQCAATPLNRPVLFEVMPRHRLIATFAFVGFVVGTIGALVLPSDSED